MGRITVRTVAAAKADPSAQWFLWDDALPGFGLCVKPSGARSYVIQYRNAEGRSRRMVVGKVGTLTPEEARELARDMLASVRKGADPLAKKREARDAMTVAELCDWYLREAERGVILGRAGRPIKPTTLAMDRSRIEQHVKPLLGRRSALALPREDIARFQADVAAGKTAKERVAGRRGGATRGGSGVAARTLGMLMTIFEHAKHQGLIAENRARGVKKLPDRKADRYLSEDELRALGVVLRAAEEGEENRNAVAAIRLLLLTGLRRLEALGLRAAWVDERGGCIRFPDTKSGAQLRPVGGPALSLMQERMKSGTDYLFPGNGKKRHFVGLPRVLERVCQRAAISGVTVHTLRHTFGAVAAELGFSELTIAGLLGHSVPGVTARYAHVPDSALVQAADRVATRISGILENRPDASVIEFRPAPSRASK